MKNKMKKWRREGTGRQATFMINLNRTAAVSDLMSALLKRAGIVLETR